MYAWLKYPYIGPRVSILLHHYININLQAKIDEGIISVITYSMYMQPICQKYYVFQIFDPLTIGLISILPQKFVKGCKFSKFLTRM